MRLKFFYTIVFLIAGFFFPEIVCSQQNATVVVKDSSAIEPRYFDQSHIAEYKKDKDFDYTRNEQEHPWIKAIKRWFYKILIKIFNWIFGHKNGVKYLAIMLKYLPYIFLAVLSFFIIKFLLQVDLKEILTGIPDEPVVNYGTDEEIIRKQDIDKLIREALEKGDLRLAVRYYYLKLLKLLEQKQFINWEAQKTNWEYLKEIKDENVKSGFKRFTNWYDYIWYGNYPVGEHEFDIISKEFSSFFNKLGLG